MTRLIDGDALERAIYEWMPKDQEAWIDSDIPPIENLVVSIMMTIQEQPTVDAIPIEWIFDWENRYMNALPPEFQGETVIELFMEDWRKEQEKQND